jgi:Protein of unknown function (DUF3124)
MLPETFMKARSSITRAVCLLIAAGLLGSCTAQQKEQISPSNKPSQVEELTRLPPTFPGEELSPSSQPPVPITAAEIEQTVYVPAYSHVYYRSGQEYLLAITLSIRNTSLTDSILVKSVRYYDTKGRLVKQYSKDRLQIPPMATAEFFVQDEDTSGGSGANFIVEWKTKKGVDEPIVEAIMIGTSSGQGISLVSPGRTISKTR